jgi:hypothetical protein
MATGYGLDGRVSNPGRDKILFSIPSRMAMGSIQHPIKWVLGVLSSGVKRQGRKADKSPPSSAKVKNGGSIPPLPYISSGHDA